MNAMGCPLINCCARMPLLPPEVAKQLKAEHREKNPLDTPLPFSALVARPVTKKERHSTPLALEAVAKEWARLRSIKHKRGVGVWDESKVRESPTSLLTPLPAAS